MMYLYGASMLILIVGTHGFVRNYRDAPDPEVSFRVEPLMIEPGITEEFVTNCSVKLSTDAEEILSISISKGFMANDTDRKNIVGISSLQGVTKHDPKLKAVVEGSVDQRTSGYLSLRWKDPQSSEHGIYLCRVIVFSAMGTSVLDSSKVEVTYKTPDVSTLIRLMQSVNRNLSEDVRNLEEQSLHLEQQGSSQQDIIRYLLRSGFYVSDAWKGRRYYLSNYKQESGAFGSELICEAMGGYLMEPDTKEEFDHVLKFIKSHPKNTWKTRVAIGGTDKDKEGTWKTIHSNKDVGYIRWTQDPNNWHDNENCLEIWKNKGCNDYWCEDSRLQFMCEVPEQR